MQRWTPPLEPPDPLGMRTAPAPTGDSESGLKLVLNFLSLLRRNIAIVATCVVVAFLGALAFIHYQRPVYRATAVIRLEDKARALSGGLASSEDAGDRMLGQGTDPILSQIQVLQSRAVALEIANRQGLRLRPIGRPFNADLLQDKFVDPKAGTDTIRLHLGASNYTAQLGTRASTAAYGAPVDLQSVRFTLVQRPAVADAKLLILPVDVVVDEVQSSLRGKPRERTDVVDVTYLAGSPLEAQRSANAAVTVFSELNARTARQESVRRRTFIEQQLLKAESMLAQAQAAHNAFRRQAQVYSSEEKFRGTQTDFAALELRRQELGADRSLLQGLLHDLERRPGAAAMSNERLSTIISTPGIASNAVVVQLYEQVMRLQGARDSLTTGKFASSADNPDVRRIDALRLEAESRLTAALRGQLTSVDARLSSLDSMRARTSQTLTSLPQQEAQEAQLLAQVQTYTQEAGHLREELQKAQIQEAAEAGQIVIVDLAPLPDKPTGTGPGPKLALAVLLGLFLGATMAYFFENYRAVIRKREDVDRVSAAAILAIVPPFDHVAQGRAKLLPWRKTERHREAISLGTHPDELVTMVDVRSHAAESYRTMRTNLLFSTAVRDMRMLMVTSSGPAEGKSTTAGNLAVTFAQQGKRVLLIDCDLRRPRLHKMFRVSQMPGLTNAIMGGVSHAEIILPSGIENLSLMVAGPTPPNPVELLGSDKMSALLERLSESYDLLVLDTPPVLVASDASILSRHVDGTIFVVRAGQTQVAALRDGIERLAAVGTQVLGTVINDPDGEVAKFASYYGYYYNQYYGESTA